MSGSRLMGFAAGYPLGIPAGGLQPRLDVSQRIQFPAAMPLVR